jgi:hypothetical protein
MRPGNRAARVPNCSAITSGAWLGSMTPPDPTRMVAVPAATCPTTTAVAALATPGMLWCSATQNRRYPRRSARRARSSVLRRDSAAVPPARMGDRSRTDRGRSGTVVITTQKGCRHPGIPPGRQICHPGRGGPPINSTSPSGWRAGPPPLSPPDVAPSHGSAVPAAGVVHACRPVGRGAGVGTATSRPGSPAADAPGGRPAARPDRPGAGRRRGRGRGRPAPGRRPAVGADAGGPGVVARGAAGRQPHHRLRLDPVLVHHRHGQRVQPAGAVRGPAGRVPAEPELAARRAGRRPGPAGVPVGVRGRGHPARQRLPLHPAPRAGQPPARRQRRPAPNCTASTRSRCTPRRACPTSGRGAPR